MLHRKCKAAMLELQERNDQLTRANEARARRVSELEAKLAESVRESANANKRAVARDRDLDLYRDACRVIAASSIARSARCVRRSGHFQMM